MCIELEDMGWKNDLFYFGNKKYIYHLSVGITKILSLSCFSHIGIEDISWNCWEDLKKLRRPYNWREEWNHLHDPDYKKYGGLNLISLAQICEVVSIHHGLWCLACERALHPGPCPSFYGDGDKPFAYESFHWSLGLCEKCRDQVGPLYIGEQDEIVAAFIKNKKSINGLKVKIVSGEIIIRKRGEHEKWRAAYDALTELGIKI